LLRWATDTLVRVNDTLGLGEWIRVLDVNGLGKDSVGLNLQPDVTDLSGLRILTSNPQSDAFGYVRFRALSGPKPAWNRMHATLANISVGVGTQSPSLLLEWLSQAETSLYPNPFTDALYLHWEGLDSVSFLWEILDMTGRRVQEGLYQGSAFWSPDLIDLQPQAYLLRLEWPGGEVEYRRIIKG
jgi:hypothetical protein